MTKQRTKKAYALIIREVAGECQLLTFEFRSLDYSFLRLPGGNVEGCETPLEAAQRETFEEAGISSLQLIREVGTTRYYKPYIQANVERTDFLFTSPVPLPDTFHKTGTVGSEAGVVFDFSWIAEAELDRVDPELRTFLKKEHIPELFA